MQSLKPIPVRPVHLQRSPRYLELAAWAATKAAIGGMGTHDPVATARVLGGDAGEVAALLLQRSAITGATTSVSGWASQLATTGVSDFLTGLVPQSAMATVIGRGTVIPLGEFASLSLPYRLPVATGGWVGEAQPIPAAILTLSSATLSPRKAGVIITFTRELASYAGAEAIFTAMLRSAAAATIDGLYLSTTAASADACAGLLNGVSATVSSGTALGDLSLLAKACQGVDGSGSMIFVTTPAIAAELSLRMDIRPETTILGSVAVPAGRIIGIDPAGIVHAVNPSPSIEASEEAVIHEETVPLQIATGAQGSGVLATPTQSLWQTSQIALRMLVDLGWAKWRADCTQFIDAITWA
jgi:hypothetical protein